MNAFAANNALQANIEAAGMQIPLKYIRPATSRFRSIHEDAIVELQQSLKKGWNTSFSMITVRIAHSLVKVVDGSHRHAALMRLLAAGLISEEYPVLCTVLQISTPATALMALAGKTNVDNETFQKMTLPDRVFYIVIVIREALQQRNAPFSPECLWTVSRTEIQALLQDGNGSTVQIATSASMLDGLLACVRQWVTAHDAANWGNTLPKAALYGSLWQNIAFLNECGSSWWVALYQRWDKYITAAGQGKDWVGPTQEQYAAELKRNGLVQYTAVYPGIFNAEEYIRKALEKAGPKHMRPKYEFIWQRIAAYFLLHGKAPPRAFTEVVVKQWAAPDSQEADLFALWARASGIRKDYDASMASTIWHAPSKCDWPGCPGDDTTVVAPCDACNPSATPVYHACQPCSKIAELFSVWPESRLVKRNQDGQQEPMTLCPVCVVAYVTRTRHAGSDDSIRVEWPVMAVRQNKDADKLDCITCCVGYDCDVHGTKQFWSKAEGLYVIDDLALNQRTWFQGQHEGLSKIFANLSERTFHAAERRRFHIAREIEIKVALGCTDAAPMWELIDPTRKPRVFKSLATIQRASLVAPETPLAAKLAFYDKMLREAAPTGPNRSIRIEHTSWQKWWETAKTDETQKGLYQFVFLDPMYYDMPDSTDFELLRALLNYVTTPGAVVLLFHGFAHIVAYAQEICKPSNRKTVSNCITSAHYCNFVTLGCEISYGPRTSCVQACR